MTDRHPFSRWMLLISFVLLSGCAGAAPEAQMGGVVVGIEPTLHLAYQIERAACDRDEACRDEVDARWGVVLQAYEAFRAAFCAAEPEACGS